MRNLFCCFKKKKKQEKQTKRIPIRRSEQLIGGPSIIIIGAGSAGLACAVKLLEHGIEKIIILEAENRIGGRIHTVPFGKNRVDLGAQWVHGEVNNIVYESVKDLNLVQHSKGMYATYECIRSNGDIVPADHVSQMNDIIAGIFLNGRDEMAEFEGSLGDFLELKFFEALEDPEFAEIDREVSREFFENFKKLESSESSLELNEVSARGFIQYWDCEGDYMINWKDKGYEQFLRVLTRASPDENIAGKLSKKIVLGAKVKQILWDQDDGLVRVYCHDRDAVYVADSVVITVSLGVLKKYAKKMFNPTLPHEKLLAIDGIGYGDVLKIFVEFPHAFWPSDWNGFTTLWRAEDLDDLRDRNLLWIQDIYGFYVVNDRPRVLQAWAVGANVPNMEQLQLQELQVLILNLMKIFLPHFKVPEPKNIVISNWSSNDNFRGAYSFRTLHTESVGTNASELAKPIHTVLEVVLRSRDHLHRMDDATSLRATFKPTLLFAGEATSPHYFSTVHGAVESGFREGKRLAGYYDVEK